MDVHVVKYQRRAGGGTRGGEGVSSKLQRGSKFGEVWMGDSAKRRCSGRHERSSAEFLRSGERGQRDWTRSVCDASEWWWWGMRFLDF